MYINMNKIIYIFWWRPVFEKNIISIINYNICNLLIQIIDII